MLKNTRFNSHNYFKQLRSIDLLDFNKFIFRHLIVHFFKTETILPFIIAACVIGFSLIIQQSRFIFIPQTSVAAFTSFFIFLLVVSLLTLLIYPIFIILLANFICSYLKPTLAHKYTIKSCVLLAGYISSITLFAGQGNSVEIKLEIILIWIGVYFILSGLYLTHLKHGTLAKLTKTKIFFIIAVSTLMTRPLLLIFLHATEVMNFTNINTQVYLTSANCALLQDLDEKHQLAKENSIFYSRDYYQELPNRQGCYIYNNVIRYSFAYDFVLMIKKNIHPLIAANQIPYNEYVRLSCYASNCYSENHIFFPVDTDINAELLAKTDKFYLTPL